MSTPRSTWKRRQRNAVRLFGARRQPLSASSGLPEPTCSDSTAGLDSRYPQAAFPTWGGWGRSPQGDGPRSPGEKSQNARDEPRFVAFVSASFGDVGSGPQSGEAAQVVIIRADKAGR
jgi:hypothetical protein